MADKTKVEIKDKRLDRLRILSDRRAATYSELDEYRAAISTDLTLDDIVAHRYWKDWTDALHRYDRHDGAHLYGMSVNEKTCEDVEVWVMRTTLQAPGAAIKKFLEGATPSTQAEWDAAVAVLSAKIEKARDNAPE